MHKTVILGREYEEAVWQSLRSVLKDLGGVVEDENWGVGGSQELTSADVIVGGQHITVEAETYIGISVSGESELIDQIQAAVVSRLSANKDHP
ncbi:MAG: hypothetical protein MN733_41305 [Nitrososphaera sp.]|nr:hypothetical protein [Nitrososphaera sp.]